MTGAIREFVAEGHLQLELFDERNLFELHHPDFPGERLVACRNPELATLLARKRHALLEATWREIEKVKGMVARGKLRGQGAIGFRVGKVINKYKVAKRFRLTIREDGLNFQIDEAQVADEVALDGLCVIRTSVPPERLGPDDTVRGYKFLGQVERAFCSLKTIDLKIRLIHHRIKAWVRAHIFLCMLAYYVEWSRFEAWRLLQLPDEDQPAKQTGDPVPAAERSVATLRKVHAKLLDDGTVVHNFRTLLKQLSGIVRNVCRRQGGGSDEPIFVIVTTPDPRQQRAFDLLKAITL